VFPTDCEKYYNNDVSTVRKSCDTSVDKVVLTTRWLGVFTQQK